MRSRRIAALLLALAMVAVSCSSDSGETTTTSGGDTETTAGSSDTTEAPGGSGEGTVVAALTGDIDNFDPHTNQLILFQYSVKENVFETLVGYDEDLNLVPELAESWEVNDDASEYTFTLVEDATFHDGTPVTAEAVVANLERVGEQDSVWAGRVALVEEYETPDERTVIIRLSQPSAPFLDGLTGLSIMSPDSFENAVESPVGSGPFQFVEWVPNDHILLERNDDYWGDPVAYAELELRPIPDSQVAYTNLQAGEVDVVVTASTALVEQAEAAGDGEIVKPNFSNSMTLIEMSGIEDVLVRRAIAHALDRDAVNEVAFGGQGEIADSPLPKGNFAYCEVESYDYDLEAAEALLEEAGAEDFAFQMEVLSGRPQAEQLGRIWQQGLEAIGVDLTINVSELSVWLDYYVNRDYDVTWNGFNHPADPHPYWELVMGEDRRTPEVEELFQAAAASSDMEERADLYCQLQELALENLEIFPVILEPLNSIVASDRVSGYELWPNGWGIFTNMTVDE